MSIFIPVIIVIVIILMLWGWSTVLRRVPLIDFGMENVERILNEESEDYRNIVLKRGWITNKEWTKLQKKHNSIYRRT